MNSIWNRNITLFKKRFPFLAETFGFNELPEDLPEHFRAPIEVVESKQKIFTAKDNGKFLHSLYNPSRESEQIAEKAKNLNKEIFTAVFFGFGLGHAAVCYAKNYKNDTLVLVEPNPAYFFTALAYCDWTEIFAVKNLVLLIQAGPESVIQIIEKAGGFKHCSIIQNQNQTEHAKDYFSTLNSLVERNKQKASLNTATLEKFSKLWLKNSCRNLKHFAELDGVNIYKDKGKAFPFVILAAGPTLSEILPYLKEIKKKAVIIAVDTALRACLREKVEPDFIVLTDPQYYAAMHIQGLKSKSSILITESAAYNSVFRFECKKIVLCSSLFPLGKYIESKTDFKGELSTGGSVTTTAWDFARLCGAKEIYISGLDLGFPDFQTHIRGSTFEEKIHQSSKRLQPAEKSGVSALFGANMLYDEDYAGKKILTDNRMKMFAWWFESKSAQFPEISSYSLSSRSLKIPGIKIASIQDILSKNDIEKTDFLQLSSISENAKARQEKFQKTIAELLAGFDSLAETARKGFNIADRATSEYRTKSALFNQKLTEIDSDILASEFKDIASLVFPTENQLNRIYENSNLSSDSILSSFQKSKIIYKELQKSISEYKENIAKFFHNN